MNSIYFLCNFFNVTDSICLLKKLNLLRMCCSHPDKSDIALKFSIPQLPKLEIFAYFAIWICHSLFSVLQVFKASRDFKTALPTVHNGKDTADYEWVIWPQIAMKMTPWLIGHNLMFNYLNQDNAKHRLLTFCYSLVGHLVLYGWYTVGATVICGLLVFVVAIAFKKSFAVWLVIIALLVYSENILYANTMINDEVQQFMTLTLFAYKLVQYLSFNIDMLESDNTEKKPYYPQKLFEMYSYAFYFPYTTMVIVLHKDYRSQLAHRQRKSAFFLITFTLRISFWILFNEIVLRYFYFNSFMKFPDVLNKTSDSTILSVGYLAGQFFHTKYVAIFGFHAIFAHMDGMTPPKMPICISHVSLYSNLWRYFDRGLYSFIKTYIYIPLVKMSNVNLVAIFGVGMSYLFVIAWHGSSKKHIYWITLSFIEIILERVGVAIYKNKQINQWITTNLSAANFRRLLALLQNVCIATGIFGVWYFLGAEGTGEYMSQKIWWEEGLKFDHRFWHLIILGYCFNQCCMEIERYKLLHG